jgi:thiol-disulfide isomerase/thioredoxin
VLAVALTLVIAGCEDDARDPANAPRSTADIAADTIGRTAPLDEPYAAPSDLTVQTTGGETLAIGPEDGSVQIINFWATWCAPCLEEIPDLNKLHEELGPDGLQIIGVAKDQGRSEVVPFAERRNIEYPVVADSTGTVGDALGPVYVLPTSLIITPDDTVRYKIPGIFPSDALRDRLKTMLNAPATSAK